MTGPAHGEWVDRLESLYRRYNRRSCISPDPLEIVYRYSDPADQEIAGLVSALLAYGGVKQIVASAGAAMRVMGASPARFIRESSPPRIGDAFRGFRHRWTSGADLALLLQGAKCALEAYGSLEQSFIRGYRADHETLLPALAEWVRVLRGRHRPSRDLLSCPGKGSACKRLNLFLRWMVRHDEVDPGLWRGLPCAKLVVPLDLHMFRIARRWRLTRRKQADLKAALEITGAFRAVQPHDPVRYDFALTRAAMRGEIL